MKPYIAIGLAVFGLLFGGVSAADISVEVSPVRGIGVGVEVREASGERVTLYAESHALLIGVSDYDNGWPDLPGVLDDIPAVQAALVAQGFQVTKVMDPDREGLEKAFSDFIKNHGQNPNNRLLFYFAGHGHSMELSYGGRMGYLVGRDAPDPGRDKVGFKDRALSMKVIETYALSIESKHALFVFDSCFSGSVFDATRAIPDTIQQKTGQPVRQFITSGTADQKVPDNSIFRRQFVAALAGEGDRDQDGYVTGAELGMFLQDKVTNYSRKSQTPQYGKLPDPKLDKGDFVFVLPGGGGDEGDDENGDSEPDSVDNQTRVEVELAFWNSIGDSDNVALYDAYLSKYPQGTFAEVAREKIKELSSLYDVTPLDRRMWARENANLREAPTAGSKKLGVLRSGSEVSVTGRARVEGSVWYRVGLSEGRSGFVFGDLLTADGPPPPPLPAVFRDCGDMVVASGEALPSGVFCGPEMVVVPSGSFMMGSNDGGGDEKPRHRVNIDYTFAVGKYEVTQSEWQSVMGRNPSRFKGGDRPVEKVSWEDAQEFITKLNDRTGRSYRLLTEAEWEYVARAGTTTKYSWGNSIGSGNANCDGCGSRWDRKETAPVGSFGANGFGLYDMHGNVWELVADCYDRNAYETHQSYPQMVRTWHDSCDRVVRGGSWFNGPWLLSSAVRVIDSPTYSYGNVGFRVARTVFGP